MSAAPGPRPYICNRSVAIILPLDMVFAEAWWPLELRAVLYILGLFWLFVAVAYVSDIFMLSIETITSKTKEISIMDAEAGPLKVEIQIWNETVANLSLLALGTSAPEILLSVIEIVGQDFRAGDLGPGTIVGSAAFNLFIIPAICMGAIPKGEIRRIRAIKVFAITSCSGIGAYTWMAVVLTLWTPDVVTIEEAVITLLFFPLLIVVAYIADTRGNQVDDDALKDISLQDSDRLPSSFPGSWTNTSVVNQQDSVLLFKQSRRGSNNIGFYRINASRNLTGGRTIENELSALVKVVEKAVVKQQLDIEAERLSATSPVDPEKEPLAVVSFDKGTIDVMENVGAVKLGISRSGELHRRASVRVKTCDCTANEGEDYVAVDQVVTFGKDDLHKEIEIHIIDDDVWEPDEYFFVQLTPALPDKDCTIGQFKTCVIKITDNDVQDEVSLTEPSFVFKESVGVVSIPVVRVHKDSPQPARVSWQAVDHTAVHGVHYVGNSGILVFGNDEDVKYIDINISDKRDLKKTHSFELKLVNPSLGTVLGKYDRTFINIIEDLAYQAMQADKFAILQDTVQVSYRQRFYEAMTVSGGRDASILNYVLHLIAFPWKVFFAFIPPCHYLGGWPTFVSSLAVIGFLTALIGDMAKIFGCLVGLADAITAITLVAFGTSMPDTFASRTAAVMEKTADASIGNVNGSNSVNVFLGLGLPWLIASVYWQAKGEAFRVPSGSLGFSVMLFTCCAVVAVGVFTVRRRSKAIGGELGGPEAAKRVSMLVFISLWVVYITVSILKTNEII